SDNGTIGPYNKIDTLFKNLAVESIDWHPKTGYLWVSSGNLFAPCGAEFTNFSFYAFKLPDYTSPVDSFTYSARADQYADDPRPRGIAFSPSGDTVYVTQFNSSLTPIVQRFIGKSSSGVARRVGDVVVANYQLAQNYPNPFNPSTTINFSLPVASNVTLKVYNMLGAEVATVAQGLHAPGAYSVRFDASNLASGVYVYTLRTSSGFVQSNKMLLMK
ncbi:MAG: T9SS type A sorting domain-containing protein, partial [Ignavibacteriales bacterium]|nr:T9SS type A sorting domain-containing protein [Ignavibacteriales bacterium]